ncbi:MAG: hypothetical protein M3Y21_08330 [Candidatus Eremiobacteraeota bacterium]|nr:hypothetical protein [Candidatus Eremiobacteraeota bacterium]
MNRPTVGFSACAIAPGTIVLEEGYQNQINGSGDALSATNIQYPQSFTRFGIAPRFELDAIGPAYNTLATPDGRGGFVRTHGYQDSGVGFKFEFAPKGRYTIAIDGLYTAPTGSAGFSAGGSTETADVDLAYAVTPTFGIGTTISASSTSGSRADGSIARYRVFLPSIVTTLQLPHAYQLYAEYVYASKLAPDRDGRAFVDYGVQKLLGKRFELDAELGASITPDLTKKFNYLGIGLGIQLR